MNGLIFLLAIALDYYRQIITILHISKYHLVSSVVNHIACSQRQVCGTCFYSLGCFKIRYITFIWICIWNIYVVLSCSICIHKCTYIIFDIRKLVICTKLNKCIIASILTFEVCSTILPIQVLQRAISECICSSVRDISSRCFKNFMMKSTTDCPL